MSDLELTIPSVGSSPPSILLASLVFETPDQPSLLLSFILLGWGQFNPIARVFGGPVDML